MASPFSRSMPRREFLRHSATAAAGLAASGLIDPARLFAGTNDILPLLSVGFADTVPEPGHRVVLSAANSMLMSDPGFLRRGAQVAIVGSAAAARSDMRDRSIEFNAIYPAYSRTPAQYPRFVAWRTQVKDDVRTMSGGIRFTMPVTATDGIKFLIHSAPTTAPVVASAGIQAPDPNHANELSLSLSSGDGPKLQRGVYVVAFRESGSDSVPMWSRLTLQNKDGAFSVDSLPASYIVLTVDYVANEEPVITRPPAKARI